MKPIHHLLRQRLHGAQKPIIEHPPIDLLGAFAEKALSGFERASVLTHLSQCEDCRDLVFLAAPEVITRPPVFAASRRWNSWPVSRWASAAACAVIVFAALRLRPSHPVTGTFVPAPTISHNSTTTSGSYPQVHSEYAEPTKPSIAADQQIHGKAKEPGKISGLQEESFHQQAVVQQASFGGFINPRWTLTTEGSLERSLDNGASWHHIAVPQGRPVHVVAADGLHIWLGGERGTLLHSPDAGRHWEQLKPVIGDDNLIADIIAIQFDDTQHGMLTTFGDGTWMTSDGGQSWEKQ